MIEVALGFMALAAAGGTGFTVWGRDRLLRRRMRETVVATMKTGAAFRGVLFEADGRSLVLRNAEALRPGDESLIPVDGEVLLARSDVEFLQRP